MAAGHTVICKTCCAIRVLLADRLLGCVQSCDMVPTMCVCPMLITNGDVQMAGLGPSEFFSEGFNVFDLVVVALSLLELTLMRQSGGDGSSLSALRTFRMLRIMKSFRVLRMLRMFRCAVAAKCPSRPHYRLVNCSLLSDNLPHSGMLASTLLSAAPASGRVETCRHLEALRTMGEVLSESLEAFIAVTFLVLMFIVVFTTLGLHMFGDLQLEPVSPNFTTFMNAFLTVFQVSSQLSH